MLDCYCDFWGEPSSVVLEHGMKISSSKWWRIKNSKTKLFFSDFLNLIDHSGNDVFSFLSKFLGTKEFGDGKYDTRFHELENRFLNENPDAAFIMVAISTDAYRKSKDPHNIEIIQNVSRIEKNRFEFLFKRLLDLKIIEFNEEANAYKRTVYKTDVRTDKWYDSAKSLFVHCLDRQSDFLNKPHNPGDVAFATKVMPVSPAAYKEMKEQFRKFYAEITRIVEEDTFEDDKQMGFLQFGAMMMLKVKKQG